MTSTAAGERAPVLLTLRALGLGDLLAVVPALRALRRGFPAHRHLLATAPSLGPLALLTGAVDGVVPRAGLGALPATMHAPAVAVNMHGRGPQSHRILQRLQPHVLLAFDNHEAGHAGPPFVEGEHEVVRWCRLLRAHGIAADPGDLDLDVPVDAAPPVAHGAVLLHPGAGSQARRWPADRWVEVAREIGSGGQRVVLTGSSAEREAALAIACAAGLGPQAVLAGVTDVVGLAGAVAVASRVVSGDTGVAHLATAVGTPSVVLFGPVSPAEWGPPPDRPWHIALWRGERGDPHAAETHRGLLALAPDDVLSALERLDHLDRPVRARTA